MTEQTALPESIRRTFEQYGVIKRIAVPKLDLLDKAINDRKGRWEVQKGSDGVAVASVTIQGQKFDGAADEANLALSVAFASALLGTQPRQGGLFDIAPSEPYRGDDDGIDAYEPRFADPDDDIELDDDLTPHASGLIPDAVSPAIEVERTLKAAGIPVRYDADSGLYRNPLGDAYPTGWAEQESGIQARAMGFRTSQ